MHNWNNKPERDNTHDALLLLKVLVHLSRGRTSQALRPLWEADVGLVPGSPKTLKSFQISGGKISRRRRLVPSR